MPSGFGAAGKQPAPREKGRCIAHGGVARFPRLMTKQPSSDWTRIANDPAFLELKRARRRFTIPATIFFLVYYTALPVLVGFFPEIMKTPVLGKVNAAYIFALSQFIMTWVLCGMYVRVARRWDVMNATLLARLAPSNVTTSN